MKITMIDSNAKGIETMVQALGICRNKECTATSLIHAMDAKPVPHASVLEFAWVCLLVEGVSVKTRIQLERHRMFSSIERSTRSIDMSHKECIIPSTTMDTKSLDYNCLEAMGNYSDAIFMGESYEDASYLLPLAIETSFFLAGNLRVFFEYFSKRLCSKHVQDEHYRMALEMYIIICKEYPIMRKAQPCKACGMCKEENNE